MPVLLAYGDSNTHGTLPLAHLQDFRRLPWEARWPGRLAGRLPGWRVIEEGLPGRTTVHADPIGGAHRNGLAVLPAILESHQPIDLVVLMLGTNDLKARFAIPVPEVATAIEKLVLAIRTAPAGPAGRAPDLLLVAPPRVEERGCLAEIFAGGAAKSVRLAPLVEAVARRHGTGFLDAGRIVAPSAIDGVHLDAAAHATLGDAVADAVLARHRGGAA
jgi:lysophospholipase L1-like esterase